MTLAASYACMECDEVITEPICSGCLSKRMQEFVGESDPELAKEIENLVVPEGDSPCLFCGKKMNLCAHCFSREVYQFILEKNAPLAEDFLGKFDFELRSSLF